MPQATMSHRESLHSHAQPIKISFTNQPLSPSPPISKVINIVPNLTYRIEYSLNTIAPHLSQVLWKCLDSQTIILTALSFIVIHRDSVVVAGCSTIPYIVTPQKTMPVSNDTYSGGESSSDTFMFKPIKVSLVSYGQLLRL